jgi:hypothetical protein
VRCKWAVFDACEVLASRDGSTASFRFKNAFAGLHHILGFASVCSDSDDRGRVFADRLNDGDTIRDAWIRACQETEEADRVVSWIRTDGASLDDQWPGDGRFVSSEQSAALTSGSRNC